MPKHNNFSAKKKTSLPGISKKKGKGSRERISRTEGDARFFRYGRRIRKTFDRKRKIPSYDFSDEARPDVLERFVDKKRKLRSNAAVNRVFRAAWKRMDETFSTASTRELVRGILDEEGVDELSDKEWDYLVELIDVLSNIRLKTEYTGFSTKDAVMQHPANRAKAVFADPYATASEHAEMDSERRDYVIRAIDAAIDDGADAREIVVAGARAAIEFTLNYFAAPVTASNVQPFSRRANTKRTDPVNQEQLAGRERLKGIYEQLGGTLSPLDEPETQAEAQTRPWQLNLPDDIDVDEDPYPFAPPSPRRQVEGYL
ncbi:hypothetical protein H2509_20215 [Stappia sp. F7233]|uniref:Uncharacterized protein n=1 Tax=Stappia albiluteola TaxID=2758565 RepID=A0A839AIB0_9HYPH|nr:hypothetical protein [Stappia albiluteola]MBA5779463.1 hypothetical protein [Stappia albiluteola]